MRTADNENSTVDVLRHANAPAIKGINLPNKYRYLSSVGVTQSYDLRHQLKTEGTQAEIILYSPAPRSLMTAAIAYEMYFPKLVELSELFTPEGEDGHFIDEAFYPPPEGKGYGYDFSKYMKDEPVWAALSRLGAAAAQAIRREQEKWGTQKLGRGGVTVAATSAVFANMIAFYLAGCSEEARQICFGVNLGEAERFRVEDGKVRHIPLVERKYDINLGISAVLSDGG